MVQIRHAGLEAGCISLVVHTILPCAQLAIDHDGGSGVSGRGSSSQARLFFELASHIYLGMCVLIRCVCLACGPYHYLAYGYRKNIASKPKLCGHRPQVENEAITMIYKEL